MKQIIPMNEYGIFADSAEIARVDSRFVAEAFDKNHKEVLREIKKLLSPEYGLSQDFSQRNFAPASYLDSQHKKRPCYTMTRDGFTFLVMGYTGQKAAQFKEAYIRRFNEMDAFIHSLREARQTFPLLTDSISRIHENPKPYHYSNECDMINRIVLGVSAKKYRELHEIPEGESIRPYLTSEQIDQIDDLQIADVGYLDMVPDFQERKKLLKRRHLRSIERQSNTSRRLPCHDVNQQINAQYFPG